MYKDRLYDHYQAAEDNEYGHQDQIKDVIDMYYPTFTETWSIKY